MREREKWPLWARPVRGVMALLLLVMPSACAYWIDNTIHPSAMEHNTFCAQYLASGQLVEAEARCKLAIEYSPKYAEPYNLLGLLEVERGHPEEAVKRFKQAISLKSEFAEAYNNLGSIFFSRRDYGYACPQFKEAVEIDPGYVDARRNLGYCHYADDDKESARDEFLKCLELNPVNCDCRTGLGLISGGRGDWNEAKSHFEQVTVACPGMAEGFYNLCWAYRNMELCPEAVAACVGAVALKPNFLEARKMLTESYQCQGFQDAIILDAIETVGRSPGDPEGYYRLGVLLKERKFLDRALGEFINAIKLDSRHALAHFEAAVILDSMLRAPETIRMCRDFVELAENDIKYKEYVAWCTGRVKALEFK